jgi:hypothetical protein
VFEAPDLRPAPPSQTDTTDVQKASSITKPESADGVTRPGEQIESDRVDGNNRLRASDVLEPTALTDGNMMTSEERDLRRLFRSEFGHRHMDIRASECGLESQCGLPEGGARFNYDPELRTDGLTRVTRRREGNSDIVDKTYDGRPDGLLSERMTINPNSSEMLRSFADSRTEQIILNADKSSTIINTDPDKSRVETHTASDGTVTTQKYDAQGKLVEDPAAKKPDAAPAVPAAPAQPMDAAPAVPAAPAQPMDAAPAVPGTPAQPMDAAPAVPAAPAQPMDAAPAVPRTPAQPTDAAPAVPAAPAQPMDAAPAVPAAPAQPNDAAPAVPATPGDGVSPEDPKAAKEREYLEQFRKELEKGNFDLPPIRSGKGPYHSLIKMQRAGQLDMPHDQLVEAARRISQREFEATGRDHFNRGDTPKMYSAKEIDQVVEGERQRYRMQNGDSAQPAPGRVEPPARVEPTTPREGALVPGDSSAVPHERRRETPPPSDGRPKLLDPVTDRAILSQVPDATYIGQEGRVTSTSNRQGTVQPYWMARDAARAIADANKLLEPLGKSVKVEGKNGAGRTIDTQTEIYRRSGSGTHFHAGAPTKSNHVRGRAMDVANYQDRDVQNALRAVGFRQGDSRGVIRGDEHHYSFPGSYRGFEAARNRFDQSRGEGTRRGSEERERGRRGEQHDRGRGRREERSSEGEQSGRRRGIPAEGERNPEPRVDPRSERSGERDRTPQPEAEHQRRHGERRRESRERGHHRHRPGDVTSTHTYSRQEGVAPDHPALAHAQGGADEKMRLQGLPSMSAAQMDRVLQEGRSPAARERIIDSATGQQITFGEHLYKLGIEYGINPAIALGFFKAESTFGRFGKATHTNSFGNIRAGHGFRGYDSFADGARDWFRLVSGPGYVGGGLNTLGKVVEKYAPPSQNDTSQYIRDVARDVRRWSSRGR